MILFDLSRARPEARFSYFAIQLLLNYLSDSSFDNFDIAVFTTAVSQLL